MTKRLKGSVRGILTFFGQNLATIPIRIYKILIAKTPRERKQRILERGTNHDLFWPILETKM